MNITDFNEMQSSMVNLLEWVNKNYEARENSLGIEFHRMADNSWGANPYTPEQVVDEYLKKVWIIKK